MSNDWFIFNNAKSSSASIDRPDNVNLETHKFSAVNDDIFAVSANDRRPDISIFFESDDNIPDTVAASVENTASIVVRLSKIILSDTISLAVNPSLNVA